MLTHDHNDFPSDVFTVMAAAGATLTIGTCMCVCCDYKYNEIPQCLCI